MGIDFGTDSVRTIVVDTSNGDVLADASSDYRRWKEGKYCNPSRNRFRQHPKDHMESLKLAVQNALSELSAPTIGDIRAISIAGTGSTPIAVNKEGLPLAMVDGFEENPNAMFVLWKDHTALREAREINDLAHSGSFIDYTEYSGGEYSSEWFWAKILHILRNDQEVRAAAYSWVEHCDWVPALLTGNTDPLTIKRSRCAAGHKAMWHAEWGGLASEGFLERLDPLLSGLRKNLYSETFTADKEAGKLTGEWAKTLGLSKNVSVGVGALDAHMGAIGGEIEPNYMVKVIGTSTCDMIVVPKNDLGDKVVKGICGQVDGLILPGMIGLEAGQSAFGDIYAWLRNVLLWPTFNLLGKLEILDERANKGVPNKMFDMLLAELSNAARDIPVEESGLVAIDWMNGRRTPDSNQNLKGAITGITLSADAPKLFKALVEATCFGSKKILDRLREEGIAIDGVIAVGGVAQKSGFVMQTLADVLDFPVKVARSGQTCALGAAMSAAVVSGIHDSYQKAKESMGGGFQKEYFPVRKNADTYKVLYRRYSRLGCFIEEEEKRTV